MTVVYKLCRQRLRQDLDDKGNGFIGLIPNIVYTLPGARTKWKTPKESQGNQSLQDKAYSEETIVRRQDVST
jgi:hypothetical protein